MTGVSAVIQELINWKWQRGRKALFDASDEISSRDRGSINA